MNKSQNKPSCFRFFSIIHLSLFFLASSAPSTAKGLAQEASDQQLGSIARVIEEAIQAGKCPGAVVLIGHDGKVEYRRAFGSRSVVPQKSAMTADTIFD